MFIDIHFELRFVYIFCQWLPLESYAYFLKILKNYNAALVGNVILSLVNIFSFKAMHLFQLSLYCDMLYIAVAHLCRIYKQLVNSNNCF